MKRLSPFILKNSYLKNVIILGLFLLCCQNASVSLPPRPLWLSLSESDGSSAQKKKKKKNNQSKRNVNYILLFSAYSLYIST